MLPRSHIRLWTAATVATFLSCFRNYDDVLAKGESLQERLKVLAGIQLQRQGQFEYDPGEVLEMAKSYDQRFAAIRKNRGLDGIGKSDAAGSLAKETFGRLTAWADKVLGGLRRRIDVE